ncbi:uncharacterized protein TrAtP1_009261 [Trichoderma atroviride]|uniref:uncharacterized protein n=1 Tax=Hypocrea atroviridis TaxID=63577 RepID=UPI00332E9F35|nr:hypothetical protein TrAtP1_009261 [Trichoderma atroviride]
MNGVVGICNYTKVRLSDIGHANIALRAVMLLSYQMYQLCLLALQPLVQCLGRLKRKFIRQREELRPRNALHWIERLNKPNYVPPPLAECKAMPCLSSHSTISRDHGAYHVTL